MKTQTGIWIDTEKAIVVTFSNGKETIQEITSNIENRIYHEKEGNKGTFMGKGIHHINEETTFDNRKENQFKKYLDEILENIKDSNEVYIFGPSESKIRLEKQIENEKSFSPKLKAVETTDKLTTNQIIEKVKYFYNL